MEARLAIEEARKLKDWLLRQPYSGDQSLYAILDAAREASIPGKLQQLGVEFVSLYRGEPEETLAAVAPYLVKLDQQARALEWLLNEGGGKSWGIFLISAASLEDLRRHFRHFLLVRDPEGKELYFRFYDPRVLRIYLPTCTAFEAKRFLGPVTNYEVESEDGQGVLDFSKRGARKIPLSELHANPATGPDSIVETSVESCVKPNTRRLKIREEQMKAFSEYMHASFDKRAADHLRTKHPAATKAMTDIELHSLIQAGVGRAGKYELTRETEVEVFLDLIMLFGVDFDARLQWGGEVLQNPDLARREKFECLREHRDAEVDRRMGNDNE